MMIGPQDRNIGPIKYSGSLPTHIGTYALAGYRAGMAHVRLPLVM